MRLLLLMLAALTGCAGAGLEIPVQKIAGTREAHSPIPAKLTLPGGPGPHPAVILLHGCGGLGATFQGINNMDRWVSRVNGWGYAALVIDSMTPRGVSSVCAAADQPKVTVTDRSGDVVSAALYLGTLKEIDATRIAVIGFSHGGATAARTATAPAGARARPLLKAAVDYYGSCGNAVSYTGLPLLALAGVDDDWGNPASSCANFGRAVGGDRPFEAVAYPGVVHGFDNPSIGVRVMSNGHPMQFDQGAAEDSYRRVLGFLGKYLK